MASRSKKLIAAESTSLALQGVAAILFGVAAVFWPGITIEALVYLVAAFLIVSGVIAGFLGTIKLGKKPSEGLTLLITGLAEITIGVAFLLWINVAFDTIVLVLALALIARGLFSLVNGSHKKESAKSLKTHTLLGGFGIIVGIVLVVYPIGTIVALVWLLGLYALIAGLLLLAMSADVSKSVK